MQNRDSRISRAPTICRVEEHKRRFLKTLENRQINDKLTAAEFKLRNRPPCRQAVNSSAKSHFAQAKIRVFPKNDPQISDPPHRTAKEQAAAWKRWGGRYTSTRLRSHMQSSVWDTNNESIGVNNCLSKDFGDLSHPSHAHGCELAGFYKSIFVCRYWQPGLVVPKR